MRVSSQEFHLGEVYSPAVSHFLNVGRTDVVLSTSADHWQVTIWFEHHCGGPLDYVREIVFVTSGEPLNPGTDYILGGFDFIGTVQPHNDHRAIHVYVETEARLA